MIKERERFAIYNNSLLPPLAMLSIMSIPHYDKKICQHRNYHIIYILSGSLKLEFSNKSFSLVKSQAFIIPPDFEYNIITENGYEYFDIILSVWSKQRETVWKHFVELTQNGIITTKPIKFEHTFEDLKKLFTLPTEINCYSLNIKAETILLNILEQIYPTENSTFKRKIAEITALNKNTLSLAMLCKLSGYSPTHFERLMLKHFGCSGIEYFNNIKLERICNLLKTTNLTLREIAEKLEFYDTSHLNTFFKKRMGITPAKYRKEN